LKRKEIIKGGSVMEEKGLCTTCVNGQDCTFPTKFPVWQCEEFTVNDVSSESEDEKRLRKGITSG